MVIATDTPIPPVYDVVFVVEKTANLAAYLETLKTSYILPTLEYFNGGPPDPTDYGNDFSCTLYAMVTFHSGDISPSPAAACEYPTTSTHKFLSYLDESEFIGGEAQSYSHISEGLSTALQVFDEIKATRNHSIPSERHCILVCNSPPYHLPSQESQDYMGFTSEQLASMLGKRGIFLSIISPRKIPSLQRLYEESCAGEIFTPNKDYTVDPRHMVLLRGFQLQERSHSPNLEEEKQTSELIKSSIGSTSTAGGRVSSPAPPSSTEGQFKVPQPTTGLQNITQQPSPQQPALSPLNQQNINQTSQAVPQQQPPPQQQPQQPPQQSLPTTGTGALTGQQVQQGGQMGMGPPMSRQMQQTNPQTKMTISTAMSTAAQQPPNAMVTIANSMAMNQASGQQVRPVFQNKQGQIINITPTLQTVKQEQNPAMFMNQRANQGQQQSQQQAGGMMAGQQRPAATMVSTQNPMTSQQGLMVTQQGMMTSQAGLMTSQSGMMTSQAGMGTTQPGMVVSQPGMMNQPNVMTTQQNLSQQHQLKLRMNPGQTNLTSAQQVSMPDNAQNIVTQPAMSMPSQQTMNPGHFMQQQAGGKGQQMVIQGPGSAPPVGGQVFPGADAGVADPTRAAQSNKKIIWKGSLEYQEKPKTQGPPNTVQQKNTKTLNCCVSITNTEPDLNARNWPEKLVMQLLPQPMLHELQSLFRNSRQVSFHFSPTDLDALRNLYRIMGTGFAGCVHFSQTANCDIRVLLLLYSSKKKAFVGLIPNDQGAFVQGIRNVLNKVRNKQQTQVNPPMTATLPMQTPPQQMQANPGIQSNPQMGGMAMQNMPITSTTQAPSAMPLQQDQMGGSNCIMMGQGQEPSGEEGMMNRQMQAAGMEQDRTSLQRRIQMLENNLQAAKQKELQYQQQEQAKKAAMVARQQQMMEEVYYPGPPPHMYTARQQIQIQQQQQQQQRLQMQQAASQQQQQQQQLHHILLNQQNQQGQQTPQQQQMRQQLLLQQQQQNMRGAAPQSQPGVMGAPGAQQSMQSQPGVMGGPGGQQPIQSQLAMQQPGQNYLDEFNLPDII